MENRKDCIEKLQQLTTTMRQLQAELLVMKEYISRYNLEKNLSSTDMNKEFKFSFEGEDTRYKITPAQITNLLEPYKI